MTWLDFTALMAALACEPAVQAFCLVASFAAGTVLGFLAQDPLRCERMDEDEAGDTHARMQWADSRQP